MIVPFLIILLVLIVLYTSIQTLYLEGMRLRSRELPALQYFKAELENKLSLRPEDGALAFSLLKHTCLIAFGVLVMAQVSGGAAVAPFEIFESVAAAWLLMMLSAYFIPQLLFRRTSGRWITVCLPLFTISALAIRPLAACMSFVNSLLDIAKPEEESEEPATPAENIDTLITAGTEEGLIEENDRRLIRSVVEFGDKVVREIMTPRPNMVTIQADKTLDALHELVVQEQFSRIPVYDTSIDDVVGFVHVRDMFEIAEIDRGRKKVRDLMRPIRLVPETKSVHDLMREMQQEGAHLVMVIDEYGSTAGLASMEDLVEVILGDIRDEHEPDTDVKDDGQGGFIVSGNFDLGRVTGLLDFHPDGEVESTTIGGLVMEWLGRVPRVGESLERDGIQVEVLASDELRVERVRLRRAEAAEA